MPAVEPTSSELTRSDSAAAQLAPITTTTTTTTTIPNSHHVGSTTTADISDPATFRDTSVRQRLALHNPNHQGHKSDHHGSSLQPTTLAPATSDQEQQQQRPSSPSDTSSVPQTAAAPALIHRMRNQRSILALVVSSARIYAGTQGGQILVYTLDTFEQITVIEGHRGSVLCLALCEEQALLFSGAGDRIVNVWSTHDHSRVYSIFSDYDIGDVFCVAYSSSLQTVYLGAQNTSIQWYDLKEKDTRPQPTLSSLPSNRADRFFDSPGPGGVRTPRPQHSEQTALHARGGQILEIDKQHIHQFAHYGYVYCMMLATNVVALDQTEVLISGGGDGVIKLWTLNRDEGGRIGELASLDDGREEGESVLAICLEGSFLYSGRLDGEVNVWDLETKQLVRSIKACTDDVLAVSVGGGILFTAGESGTVEKFGSHYESAAGFTAHTGRILASAFTVSSGRPQFITGGADATVAVWDVNDCISLPAATQKTSNERMVQSLQQFVSHRTVSSEPKYSLACRRGASYLRSLLKAFGATTQMLSTEGNLNPVILGVFKGNPAKAARRKRILFYGHYDVIAADNGKGRWRTDPFSMTGIDGYLYGRGTSDNKGPIVAAIYAVAELAAEKSLDSDIVFLIEGEEESGSRGFADVVQKNKALIGSIDWILLANSYWLNDTIPCLTYGLRGVIHATVRIESAHPDLHSGVDGSALLDESMKDAVMLLAKLTGPRGRVEIPGFYDPIPPLADEERKLYDHITQSLLRQQQQRQNHPPGQAAATTGDAASLSASLMRRWREAALTIHNFRTSGPGNTTIIPRLVEVALSLRLVPNQNTDDVSSALTAFLHSEFEKLGSRNRLTVTIDHRAEPWLGDYTNEIFKTLEEAVVDVWGPVMNASGEGDARGSGREGREGLDYFDGGADEPPANTTSMRTDSGKTNGSTRGQPANESGGQTARPATTATAANVPLPFDKPLYIREGGSIPAIRFLEKEFGAPAAHLPCGQASDNAHLDNERLRLLNLFKSRDIFKTVFRELPRK